GMAEIFRAFSGNPWLQAGTPAGEVSGSLDAGRRAFDAEAGTHWACNLVWRWDRISCDATADAAVQLRTRERQKNARFKCALPTFPECNARGNCTARALIQSCSEAYRGSTVPCIQDCRYGYAGRQKEANPEAHLGRGPLAFSG